MPPPPLKILNTPTPSKNTKFAFDYSQFSVDKQPN